jgi:hypothetical protein
LAVLLASRIHTTSREILFSARRICDPGGRHTTNTPSPWKKYLREKKKKKKRKKEKTRGCLLNIGSIPDFNLSRSSRKPNVI